MESLNLKVSLNTDAALRLKDLLGEFDDSEEMATLSAAQSTKIRRYVSDLRQTLDAELRATYAYSLVEKRVDISKLIENPASLFSPNTYKKLPDIAKYDISEAGRCIAFEVPTAAAFHLMRAVEAVLRAFYASIVRSRRKAYMWGEITEDIRKRRVGKLHVELLNHLDHIRHAFRNPTQHPDAKFDIHEVQDLWSLTVDVVNRMAPSL